MAIIKAGTLTIVRSGTTYQHKYIPENINSVRCFLRSSAGGSVSSMQMSQSLEYVNYGLTPGLCTAKYIDTSATSTENDSNVLLYIISGYIPADNGTMVACFLSLRNGNAVFHKTSIDNGTNNFVIYKEITAGGETIISIGADSNIDKITVNGNDYTTFPQSVPVIGNPEIFATGKISAYQVSINNVENLNEVKVNDTIYTNFPANILVSKHTVIEAKGKPTPEITVNYTNTKPPVITNT